MRYKLLVLLAIVYSLSGSTLKAGDVGYVYCAPGEGYVYLYQSLTSFDVLADLKCGEKVEIVNPEDNTRVSIRTLDGKQGYVGHSAITATPPDSQQQTSASAKMVSPPAPSVPPILATSPSTLPKQDQAHVVAVPSHSDAPISNPRIYVAPADGFESYLAAALVKKHVPAQIVQDKDQVDYLLGAAPVQEKPESSGGKIARCLFAYCAGIEGSQTASVTLTDAKTNTVVWAYNVRKEGSKNYQSSAEACAKHLKAWLEHTGN